MQSKEHKSITKDQIDVTPKKLSKFDSQTSQNTMSDRRNVLKINGIVKGVRCGLRGVAVIRQDIDKILRTEGRQLHEAHFLNTKAQRKIPEHKTVR